MDEFGMTDRFSIVKGSSGAGVPQGAILALKVLPLDAVKPGRRLMVVAA